MSKLHGTYYIFPEKLYLLNGINLSSKIEYEDGSKYDISLDYLVRNISIDDKKKLLHKIINEITDTLYSYITNPNKEKEQKVIIFNYKDSSLTEIGMTIKYIVTFYINKEDIYLLKNYYLIFRIKRIKQINRPHQVVNNLKYILLSPECLLDKYKYRQSPYQFIKNSVNTKNLIKFLYNDIVSFVEKRTEGVFDFMSSETLSKVIKVIVSYQLLKKLKQDEINKIIR